MSLAAGELPLLSPINEARSHLALGNDRCGDAEAGGPVPPQRGREATGACTALTSPAICMQVWD